MDTLSWQTSSAASYQNEKRARIALDIKKTRQHKRLLNVLFIINIIKYLQHSRKRINLEISYLNSAVIWQGNKNHS